MRRGLYLRLALTNLVKNRGTYLPYMLSCVGCIATLYIMLFIQANPDSAKMRGANSIGLVLSMGIVVLAIFSLIFLLYGNSFLMKRRQKEIGLYNVLGMEKRHIGRIIALETLITGIVSLVFGLAAGLLCSKLALLLLYKLIHFPVTFGFYVSGTGMLVCAAMYGGILVVTLIYNLGKVHMSRPVELLSAANAGEREPRSKLILTLLGAICLGWGYYIALSADNIFDAMLRFLGAVLLVMAGTYFLFMAGSIVVLKLMRRNKKFYYKLKNFTSVSGMLYRMKQNAVGLASICILSTGVLMMVSMSACLNAGFKDTINARYPYDVNTRFQVYTLEQAQNAERFVTDEVKKSQYPVSGLVTDMGLSFIGIEKDGEITAPSEGKGLDTNTMLEVTVIPAEMYQKNFGVEEDLKDGEVLAYDPQGKLQDHISLMGKTYQVKKALDQSPVRMGSEIEYQLKNLYLVVTDSDFETINAGQNAGFANGQGYTTTVQAGINVDGGEDTIRAFRDSLNQSLDQYKQEGNIPEGGYVMNQIKSEESATFYGLNGGLLFISILLGGVFLMGTALIIYYKQVSEGYEDRARFEIMRKVGMSRKEVRATIRRQILMVFFLPLVMAVIHICVAFPLVEKLMLAMSMANVKLFMICTAATVLVFAVVYGLIYLATARTYYKILEKAS